MGRTDDLCFYIYCAIIFYCTANSEMNVDLKCFPKGHYSLADSRCNGFVLVDYWDCTADIVPDCLDTTFKLDKNIHKLISVYNIACKNSHINTFTYQIFSI